MLTRRQTLGAFATAGLLSPRRALANPVQVGASLAADRLMQAFPQDGPAIAVAFWRAGRMLYASARGQADLEHPTPATAQTQFHAASVSKQFTALAILTLVADNKVELNADIRRYLPYVPDFGRPITVLHLLQHTSGLRDQWSLFTIAGVEGQSLRRQPQIIEMVARQRALNFDPGAEFDYCNTGYTLLAEIVRATSGQSLRQFATASIFRPLGMSSTFFYDDARELVPGRAASYAPGPDGRPQLARLNFETVGATGLTTTIDDLVTWGRELLAPRTLPAALIARLKVPGRLRDGVALNYGLGLLLGEDAGHKSIGHGGSDAGYRAMFLTFPNDNAVVAVLASGQQPASEIAQDLAAIFLGGPQVRTPTPQLPATLTALAGDYVNDWRNGMRLTVRDNALVRSSVDGPEARVEFADDGSFRFGRAGAAFRPIRDAAGRLLALAETTPWGGRPILHRPAVIASPDAAALQALAGRYRSAELDITYDFKVVGGRLVATSLQHPEPIAFTPSDTDRFDSPFARLKVRRGPGGAPDALLLDAGGGRVLNLLLNRLSTTAS